MSNLKHRQHTIRTMKQGQEWVALASRGGKAVGPRQTGQTEEAAIAAVQSHLDAVHEQQLARRGGDGYPTVDEVRSALGAVEFTPVQRAMLTAHFWAPDQTMTATQIAEAGGYDSYATANSQYGLLGRKLSEELGWQPPLTSGDRTWTTTLATGTYEVESADKQEAGHWRWKLRSEIVEALRLDGEVLGLKP